MMDAFHGKVEALDSELRQIGDSLRNYLHFGTTGVRTVKPPGTKAGRDLLQHLLARIEQVSTELTNVSKISSDASPPLPTGPDTPQSYDSPINHQPSPLPHPQQDTPPILPTEARPPPPLPPPPSPKRPSAPAPQAALLTNTDTVPPPSPRAEQQREPELAPQELEPRWNAPAQSQASQQPRPAPETLPTRGQPLLCDHASPLFPCTYRDVSILNEELFEGYSAHPVVQDRGYFKLQVEDLPPLVVEKMDRPTRDHATSFRYKIDTQGNVKVDTGKRVKFSDPRLPFPYSAKKEWTFEEQRELWNTAALNPPKGTMSYIIGNPLFDDVELAPGEKLKRRGRTILEGINTQYVYFNLTGKTITTMHREDAHVRSENLLRSGEHKFWCFVKPKSTARLEEQMKLVYPQMRNCSQAVRHLSLHIPPFQLEKWGVEYTLDYCVPGQAVVTEPGTYHQVLNLGKNYAIAINVEYMSSPDDPVDYTFCDDACPDKFAMTADDFKFHSKEPLEEEDEEQEEGEGEDTSLAVQGHLRSMQALAPPLNGRTPELPELSRVQSQKPPAPPSAQSSAESLAPPPIGEPQTAVFTPTEMDLAPRPTTEGTSSPDRTPTAEPIQTMEPRNSQPSAHGSRDELLDANVLPGTGVSSSAGSLPITQPSSSHPVLESPRLSMEQAPTPPIHPDAEPPTSLQMPVAIAKRGTVLSGDSTSDLAMPRDLPGPMVLSPELSPNSQLQPPLPRAAAKHNNPFSMPRGGNGLSLPPGPLRQLRAPYTSEKFMPYSSPIAASIPPQTLAPSSSSTASPTLERTPLHPPPPVMASPVAERLISERPPSPSMQNKLPVVPAPGPSQSTSDPASDMPAETPVSAPNVPSPELTKGRKRSATSAPAKKAPKKPRTSRKKALPQVPVSDAPPAAVTMSEVAPAPAPAPAPLAPPSPPKRIAFRSLAALVQESQKSREVAAAQCAPKAAFERLNELVQSWRWMADSFQGNPTVFTLIARVELQRDSDDAIHIFLRRFTRMMLADLATKFGQAQDGQALDLEKAMSLLLERLGWNEKDREKLYDFIREGRCWKTLCGFDDGLLCIMPLDDEFVNLAVYQQDVQELVAQFQSPVYRTLSSVGSILQAAIRSDQALPEFAWEGIDIRTLAPEQLEPILQPHVETDHNIFVLDGHEWSMPDGWKGTWPSDPTIIQVGGHCQMCKKKVKCICLATIDKRANLYFMQDGTIRTGGLFRQGKPLGELVGEMVPVGTYPDRWTMEFRRPDLEDQAVAEIYPGRYGNWVRNVNHSLTPTAEFKVMRIAGRWRVVLAPLRDLMQWEEITAKYGRGYARNMAYEAVEGLD